MLQNIFDSPLTGLINIRSQINKLFDLAINLTGCEAIETIKQINIIVDQIDISVKKKPALDLFLIFSCFRGIIQSLIGKKVVLLKYKIVTESVVSGIF